MQFMKNTKIRMKVSTSVNDQASSSCVRSSKLLKIYGLISL